MLEALRKGAAETATKLDRRVNAWRPHEGPQRQFIESEAAEVLYGGSAGGGKSFAAVALPIRWISNPDLRVLILRRRTGDLADIVDKAKKVYKFGKPSGIHSFSPVCPGVEFVGSPKNKATFPGGAVIYFDHCQNTTDWENYQGQEYQIICFEELTQFTEQQYLEIKSRCRSGSPGLPRYIRATTNPGGAGHEWVFRRWRWWMDPEATIPGRAPRLDMAGKPLPPAAPGEVLWIRRNEDGSEEVSHRDDPEATSRTFIPARLEDNPTLLAEDPSYQNKLRDFDPVRRAQLERGDWLVKPAAGLYFRRDWFGPIVQEIPPGRHVAVRRWDLAGTEPHANNPDPDWTSGVLLVKHENGLYYIKDVARTRSNPGSVKAFVESTMDLDSRRVKVRFAIDPAQAGKAQAGDYVKLALDKGLDAHARREQDPKEQRIQRISSAATPPPGELLGRLRIVAGRWNAAFVTQAEGWPDVAHDDDLDALAGAYEELVSVQIGPPPKEPMQAIRTFNLDSAGCGF
jgi:predicted phage terminase large subunit-like protein